MSIEERGFSPDVSERLSQTEIGRKTYDLMRVLTTELSSIPEVSKALVEEFFDFKRLFKRDIESQFDHKPLAEFTLNRVKYGISYQSIESGLNGFKRLWIARYKRPEPGTGNPWLIERSVRISSHYLVGLENNFQHRFLHGDLITSGGSTLGGRRDRDNFADALAALPHDLEGLISNRVLRGLK